MTREILKTNEDIIKEMSTSELAKFIYESMYYDFKPACKRSNFFSADHKPSCNDNCIECITVWLKQSGS